MKILIADANPLVRAVLRNKLQCGFRTIELEEVDNINLLLSKLSKRNWDLIITDLFTPLQTGLDVLKQIKKKLPTVPLLTFTKNLSEEYATKCILCGSMGYLTRENLSWEIIRAVRALLNGKKYLPPIVSDMFEINYEVKLIETKQKISTNWYFQLPNLLKSGKTSKELLYKLN